MAAKPLGKSAPKAIIKPGGVGSIGGAGGGVVSGGFAPASSDLTRKRLSRKSPGPELRKPSRAILPPTNVVGPETVINFIMKMAKKEQPS